MYIFCCSKNDKKVGRVKQKLKFSAFSLKFSAFKKTLAFAKSCDF